MLLMKPKPKTKNPAPVQLELFTVEPRPLKRASWPTPRGTCYRLRGAVVAATWFSKRDCDAASSRIQKIL
jgi:hypothetical protein